MAVDIQSMLTRIESIAAAEKITKKDLGSLSRDLLEYITIEDSNDIGMVNRLLAVLTPAHKRVAAPFFDHFIPFKFNDETGEFEKKERGDKKLARYVESVKTFLDDETNNLWTWQEVHLDIKPKPVNHAKKIANDVRKALNDEENGLDQVEVLEAVMAGGMGIDAVIAILNKQAEAA